MITGTAIITVPIITTALIGATEAMPGAFGAIPGGILTGILGGAATMVTIVSIPLTATTHTDIRTMAIMATRLIILSIMYVLSTTADMLIPATT